MTISDIVNAKVMQIATVRDGNPWICTVYFVLFKGNFYWLSLPERRHSKDIKDDVHVAIAIALKLDKPVVGVQAEGTATVVSDSGEVEGVLGVYVSKYNQGRKFVELFLTGKNKHRLYRFAPLKVMQFDEYLSSEMPYRDITHEIKE